MGSSSFPNDSYIPVEDSRGGIVGRCTAGSRIDEAMIYACRRKYTVRIVETSRPERTGLEDTYSSALGLYNRLKVLTYGQHPNLVI
jgi:hypothetical protein